MSDLNEDERALFDAARAGYEPREDDRKRVLKGVLLRAGVVVGVTSAATTGAAATGIAGAPLAATATASSGLVGLAFKVSLWLAVGGSLGVGGYALSRASVAHSSTQLQPASKALVRNASGPGSAAASSVQVAPKMELTAAPENPQVSPLSTARSAGERASSAARPAAHDDSSRASGAPVPAVAAFPSDASPSSAPAPSSPSSALSIEARALAQVQSALREGRNADALRLVEEQSLQFSHGELQQERDAATILALCAVGRVADARAAARDFLANSPRSPFATRIRASCAGP